MEIVDRRNYPNLSMYELYDHLTKGEEDMAYQLTRLINNNPPRLRTTIVAHRISDEVTYVRASRLRV